MPLVLGGFFGGHLSPSLSQPKLPECVSVKMFSLKKLFVRQLIAQSRSKVVKLLALWAGGLHDLAKPKHEYLRPLNETIGFLPSELLFASLISPA